jgi:epidermal growth factor receptor substrate 15
VAPPSESKPAKDGANGHFGNEEAPNTAVKNAFGDTYSHPFSAVNQDKAKHDFESAFASVKSPHATGPENSNNDVAKAFPSFTAEFPPLSELERDDDSESEIDRGGFEDDFAPASPPSKAAEKNDSHKTASASVIKLSVPETVKGSGGAPEQTAVTYGPIF